MTNWWRNWCFSFRREEVKRDSCGEKRGERGQWADVTLGAMWDVSRGVGWALKDGVSPSSSRDKWHYRCAIPTSVWGCHNKVAWAGWLETTGINSLTVGEAGSLKSGHWQGLGPSGGSEGACAPRLSLASAAAAALGAPRLADASLRSLPSLWHGRLPVRTPLPVLTRHSPLGVSRILF